MVLTCHLKDSMYGSRPGAQEFIAKLQEKFLIGVWTAASPDYAKGVCNGLFAKKPEFIFTHTQCALSRVLTGLYSMETKTVKKLSKVNYSIDHILILDDTPFTYSKNYGNAVPVPEWMGDPSDDVLSKLGDYLITTFSEFNGSVRKIEKRNWL